ncbi:MAG: histidine phosphatase family protein [Acidobacteriia bacterium]|nr:histidine phosphatase family protein [Terriglobia bacterium]
MSEKWPHTLLLLRHGQSEANVRKEAAKQAGLEPSWTEALRDMDTPLTPLGRQQAFSVGCELARRYPTSDVYRAELSLFRKLNPLQKAAPYIRENMLQYIVTSPYVRTRQTTEEVCRGLGYEPNIVVEERIREIDFGIMDGIDRETFRKLYPTEATRREKDGKYWYRPPGGENRPDVRLRVHSFLDTLNRDYVSKSVLVINHSVVVLAFRSLLERWGEEQYMQVDREDDVKNCGLTVYKREDRRRLKLQEYNTICLPMGDY